ncbi:helix-turn-helix transcriptional regulator [Paenibacillus qinlingensis]|uniref:Transcriptional regulator n=1 Tax=Paenibacillus qinlingensis TaxID=1837343 RepID=A0ABU1P6T0_9BACL|nr:helix-turn-helix transcriptional regulator [Paenibacillus qinlingensis]MDR6555468.1 putative transcriptional regulator [Paenibacillus qinlingensis]
MIKSNLALLMAEKKIRSLNKLSRETGVSAPALARLYDGTNVRIDYETIEKLCDYFNCTVGDLLVYEKQLKEKKD